jgi:hypothetical protein
MQYMKAQALVRRKEVRADGSIVEIVVWQLAEALAPCEHRYKYRFVNLAQLLADFKNDVENRK